MLNNLQPYSLGSTDLNVRLRLQTAPTPKLYM